MARQFNVIFENEQEAELHHQARVLAARRRISIHDVYIQGLRTVLEIVGDDANTSTAEEER